MALNSLASISQNGLAALPGVIPFAFPGLPQVGCIFTGSSCGNLSLDTVDGEDEKQQTVKARAVLAQTMGVAGWSELRQVHGDYLAVNPRSTVITEPPVREGDGQCTHEGRLALVIKTADCQPVLLAHKSGKYIAALHAGWRGNVMNFPGTGVRGFCRAYGIAPADVLAVRGPSLGPGAAEFINFESEWPPEFRPWFDLHTRTMNLWSLTRHQLIQAGLLPENIFSMDLCTRSLPSIFFSHRQGHRGRQMSAIWKA